MSNLVDLVNTIIQTPYLVFLNTNLNPHFFYESFLKNFYNFFINIKYTITNTIAIDTFTISLAKKSWFKYVIVSRRTIRATHMIRYIAVIIGFPIFRFILVSLLLKL